MAAKSRAQMDYTDSQQLDSLEQAALNMLERNLTDQSGWNKVHAAEYLLWTNHPDSILEFFLTEERRSGTEPEYRIGIWRVLAQVPGPDRQTKHKWKNKILAAFLDTSGPDRIHAAETLSKLRISPYKKNPDITLEALAGRDKALSLYTRWALCYASPDYLRREQKWLVSFLQSEKERARWKRLAAYIIGGIGKLPVADWKLLAAAARNESADSEAKMSLLSSAMLTAPGTMESSPLYRQLNRALMQEGMVAGSAGKIRMVLTIAHTGGRNDLPVLTDLMGKTLSSADSENADIHSAVCYAVICICRRLKEGQNSK